MEEKSGPWIEVIGVAIVFFLILTIALVAAGGWNWFARFLESSAADWAQAIGSFAAVVFAIWIATRADRRVENEQLRLAEVACALVIHDIRLLRPIASLCLQNLETGIHTRDKFSHWGRDFRQIESPDIQLISRLVPAGNDLAIEVAQVFRAAKLAATLAERTASFQHTNEQLARAAGGLEDAVREINDRCNLILKDLRTFLVSRGHTILQEGEHVNPHPAR